MFEISKAVVLGGSGMIGSFVVERLMAAGIEVVAASRRSGVDTLTGEGLEAALSGADVVVDTIDVHSFDETTLREFFFVSGENVARAERKLNVRHHVVLSIVGIEHMLRNPYYKAKFAQETIALSSGIPCTILRSAQFFEFLPTIAGGFSKGAAVSPPDALLQPIAGENVGSILAEVALERPIDETIQIAGPERAPIREWLERAFAVTNDPRSVVVDPRATWFGAPLQEKSLIPTHPDRVGTMLFEEWMTTSAAKRVLGNDRYAKAAVDLAKHVAN